MRLKQNYIHKSKISGSKCKPYLYTIMNVLKQITKIYFSHKITFDI